MFTLRFFGGFATQYRCLLLGNDVAPPALHPRFESILSGLSQPRSFVVPHSVARLWGLCLGELLPFIKRSVSLNVASALTLLCGVMISRTLLTPNSELVEMLALCGLFFCTNIFSDTLRYFDQRTRGQMVYALQGYLISLVSHAISGLDPRTRHHFTSGNLKTLVGSDIDSIVNFVGRASWSWPGMLALLLVMVPWISVSLGKIGLIAIGVLLLQIPIAIVLARITERYQIRVQRNADSISTILGEWLRNIRLVRFLGYQPAINREIGQQFRSYSVEFAKRHMLGCIVYGTSFCWWMLPLLTILWLSREWNEPFTIAQFFGGWWLISYLADRVRHFPHSLSRYAAAAAGMQRILALLQAPQRNASFLENVAPIDPDDRPITIELRDLKVNFDSQTTLDIETLRIQLRDRTAIVGSVGSGKTTLLRVLAGELAPSEGLVTITLQSGRTENLWHANVHAHLQANLGLVPQEPFLSNSTFTSNISLDDTTDPQIIEGVVSRAQMAHDVAQFASGLRQEVGETGINLSGGQKQRVSFARALHFDRPALFLDDPLSAVDAKTEQALMAELVHWSSNANSAIERGFVLVSHRLQELTHCDRLLVLESGKVIEDGTPTSLLADPDSHFNRFLQRQEHSSDGAT